MNSPTYRPAEPSHPASPPNGDAGRPRPALSTAVTRPAAAFVLCVAFGALAPFRAVDAWLHDVSVAAVGPSADPGRVVEVRAATDDLRAAGCGARLAQLIDQAGARGALLLRPVGAFCAPSGGATPGGKPAVAPPPGALRRALGGKVAGLSADAPAADFARLGLAGVTAARALRPSDLPSLALADLTEGRLDPAVLRGKVAVVALAAGGDGAERDHVDGEASAYAGLLGPGGRRAAPAWVGWLLSLALGAALAINVRRGRFRPMLLVTLAVCTLLLALQLALVAIAPASLLPVGNLALASALVLPLVGARRLRFRRRAIKKATQLMERAQHLELSTGAGPRDDFQRRVLDLAARTHPAELILLGELEPGGYELRLVPAGPNAADLVQERRRDIRRSPYVDQHGAHTPRLIFDFLVDPRQPVVIVPLVAAGEVEGYVFLCGQAARRAFEADPSRAGQLGEHLGALVRQQRLATAPPGRASDSVSSMSTSMTITGQETSYHLVVGAARALEGLEMFSTIVREVPTGVLYADAFGDVRVVSREMAAWLPALGLAADPEATLSMPQGALPLTRLLMALTGRGPGDVMAVLASLPRRQGDLELPVSLPKNGLRQPYTLSLRAIREEGEGRATTTGYVGALSDARVDLERTGHWLPPPTLLAQEPTALINSPLAAVLSMSLQRLQQRTGWSPHFDPGPPGLVVVHRPTLFDALASFLASAHAALGPRIAPCSIAVRRQQVGVELVIVGLDFDLPLSFLRSVLDNPHQAPTNFHALASLASATREGQGDAQFVPAPPRGYSLVLTLLPALTPASQANPTTLNFPPPARAPSSGPLSPSRTVAGLPFDRPR
jgi:hypothetical protein